jgi:hypothetical protein
MGVIPSRPICHPRLNYDRVGPRSRSTGQPPGIWIGFAHRHVKMQTPRGEIMEEFDFLKESGSDSLSVLIDRRDVERLDVNPTISVLSQLLRDRDTVPIPHTPPGGA